MTVDQAREAVAARLPEDLWEDLLLELQQIESAHGFGRLSCHLEVGEGRVRDFSFERRRNRSARQRRPRT